MISRLPKFVCFVRGKAQRCATQLTGHEEHQYSETGTVVIKHGLLCATEYYSNNIFQNHLTSCRYI